MKRRFFIKIISGILSSAPFVKTAAGMDSDAAPTQEGLLDSLKGEVDELAAERGSGFHFFEEIEAKMRISTDKGEYIVELPLEMFERRVKETIDGETVYVCDEVVGHSDHGVAWGWAGPGEVVVENLYLDIPVPWGWHSVNMDSEGRLPVRVKCGDTFDVTTDDGIFLTIK